MPTDGFLHKRCLQRPSGPSAALSPLTNLHFKKRASYPTEKEYRAAAMLQPGIPDITTLEMNSKLRVIKRPEK